MQDHVTQLDWFAGHCWNAAIAAAKDRHWQGAAALFASTAAYHNARQSPSTDNLTKQTVRSRLGEHGARASHLQNQRPRLRVKRAYIDCPD